MATAYTPLTELAAALRSEQAAVLSAYADETERSGHSGRSFSMAAWLGDIQAWHGYEPLWKAMLDRAGVSEFKSSDFANRRREFLGWSDDRGAEFLSGLLAIIRDADIYGTTVTLLLDVPDDPWKRPPKGSEHFACAYYCVIHLAHMADVRYRDGERIAFVFDERTSGVGRAVDNRPKLVSHLAISHPALSERIGPVTSDSSRTTLPIQAADMLTYWTYLRQQQQTDRAIQRDLVLLEQLSPILMSKVAVRATLIWKPGYMRGPSIETLSSLWDIPDNLPNLGLAWFKKDRMPESSQQAIWDENWARLMSGGESDD